VKQRVERSQEEMSEYMARPEIMEVRAESERIRDEEEEEEEALALGFEEEEDDEEAVVERLIGNQNNVRN
jgi:hypothetical protein